LLILAWAIGSTHAQSSQVIQIPAEVRAGTTVYAFTDGARMNSGVKTPGDFRFEVPPTSKLMLYVPGYAVVVHDFTSRVEDSAQPFVPRLVPLPPLRVTARLVDSSSQPIPDERVSIAYRFSPTFPFFGILDGNMPVISLSSATTDSVGAFAVDVPSRTGDPVLQRYGEGSVCLWDSTVTDSGCGFDPTLRPNTFLPGSLTAATIVIVRTELGTLAGRLGPEYLEQHRASGDPRQYARVVAEPTGPTAAAFGLLARYAHVAVDGTFSISLPKGTYNVTFVILKANSPMAQNEQRDLLQSGVDIEEGRVHRIDRP
jgi:hypothetical protein